MKKTLSLLFSLIMILTLSLPLLASATVITVSVSANSSYNRLEHADFTGSLIQDNTRVSDGFVAIQITNPSNGIVSMRTVNTGSNPQNQIATIQSSYLCNLNGNQLTTTTKGSLAYFQVTVTNNDQQARTILTTITIYDNSNSPIGFASSTATMPSRETRQAILSIPIPSTAAEGTARVFADAYSNQINAGGIPYAAELSSTFAINVAGGPVPPDTPTGNQGTYTLPITIPINAPLGTYLVSVSSAYNGLSAFTSKTYTTTQAADFNGDGKVTVTDITTFMVAYINYWNSLPYNPLADMDHNGAVNVNDISLFVYAYIQYWSWQ